MHKYEKSLKNQNPGKLIDVTQCHVLQLAEVGMNKEGYFYLFATMVIMSLFSISLLFHGTTVCLYDTTNTINKSKQVSFHLLYFSNSIQFFFRRIFQNWILNIFYTVGWTWLDLIWSTRRNLMWSHSYGNGELPIKLYTQPLATHWW